MSFWEEIENVPLCHFQVFCLRVLLWFALSLWVAWVCPHEPVTRWVKLPNSGVWDIIENSWDLTSQLCPPVQFSNWYFDLLSDFGVCVLVAFKLTGRKGCYWLFSWSPTKQLEIYQGEVERADKTDRKFSQTSWSSNFTIFLFFLIFLQWPSRRYAT